MIDRTPQQQDLDALLDFLATFAKQTLQRYGELYPFGAVMEVDGQVVARAAQLEGTNRPASQPLIDLLREGVHSLARAGSIRGAGICYDVLVQFPGRPKSDAVFFELEHRDGLSVQVWMPYTKQRFRGLKFDDLVAGPGEPSFFL